MDKNQGYRNQPYDGSQASFDTRMNDAMGHIGAAFHQHVAGQAPGISAQNIQYGPGAAAALGPARGPKRLDPALARMRRKQRQSGFDFVLANTLDEYGNPSVIRARLPNLLDTDSLAALPADMRREIFEMIEQVEGMEGAPQTGGFASAVEQMSAGEIANAFGAIASVVDAYCVIGFIEPRCFATEEEADAHNGVWVRDIEFADRMAFFNHCSNQQKGASATVKPFPDGGPVSPVGVGSVDPTVSGAGQSFDGAPAQPAASAGGTA